MRRTRQRPTPKHLILGSAALVVKTIPKFSTALSKYDSITRANGKSILLDKTLLVMSVYPNSRNKQYWREVKAAFRKISAGSPAREILGKRYPPCEK